MIPPNQLPSTFFEKHLLEKKANAIWLTTIITLHRNLNSHLFPPKMDPLQMQQICHLLKEQLSELPQLNAPLFLNAAELTPLEKDALFEHFLCLEGFHNTSHGQGFVIDNSHRFFAEINGDDHLKIHWIDSSENADLAWNDLNQIETHLHQRSGFAFSPKFGYLASSPGLCGTGLNIKVYLHVPALIHTGKIEEFLSTHAQDGLKFSSLSGTLTELTGDLLLISNQYALGENEESLLRRVYAAATKFAALEKSLRAQKEDSKTLDLKDKVSRALGLLLYSYQLKTKETLNALSLVKLGLDLGWVQGIDAEKLNRLFFTSQKGHLLHHLKEDPTSDSVHISHKRAEFLHQSLQGAQLIP